MNFGQRNLFPNSGRRIPTKKGLRFHPVPFSAHPSHRPSANVSSKGRHEQSIVWADYISLSNSLSSLCMSTQTSLSQAGHQFVWTNILFLQILIAGKFSSKQQKPNTHKLFFVSRKSGKQSTNTCTWKFLILRNL